MPKNEPDAVAGRWAALEEAVKQGLAKSSRDENHFEFDAVRFWITERWPTVLYNHFMRALTKQELLEQDPAALARDVLKGYKAWEAEHGS